MSVEVLFLGTGDAFGSGGRLQTAALIRAGGTTVLMDCGPSVLPALRAHGADPGEVDAILLTHLHGDHFGGVPFFLMDAHYASGRRRALTIAGPPGVEARVVQLQEALFPGNGRLPLPFALNWVEWPEGEVAILPDVSAAALPVSHSTEMPCYGVRVSMAGRVLAFSGDTEWTDALVDLAADADLFVCECFGYRSAPARHMDYVTLTRERRRLTCRRLLLTHLGADMLDRAGTLDDPVAADGMRLTI